MKLSFPIHTDTIVIKNEFYPAGLTQKNIYEYYSKHKNLILEQVRNREVILFINTDINKSIVRRRVSDDNLLKLNSQNFDKLITGRTVSIHSTMNRSEDFGIVDVDHHDFELAKRATADVFDLLQKISSASIRYTGKESFHVLCRFKKKQNIDDIRSYLKHILLDNLESKYTVRSVRTSQKPNLDLAPNKYRGGFITLHSLSLLGLRCMEVNRDKIIQFEKEVARV
jgi:hypothetical protein